eukprot:4774503-Ditylum_brightwellii.AAC.1
MTLNVFKFGNAFFKHLKGTAMGAPPASPYATLFFAIFEMTLLERFKYNLLLLHWFIDDIFAIWIPHDPAINAAEFTAFRVMMQE